MTMTLFNSFLSHALISILLVIMLLALRDARSTQEGRILMALCFSIICLLINSTIDNTKSTNSYYFMTYLFSIPHIGLAWWMMLSLLKDDFRLNKAACFGMIMMCFVPVIYLLDAMGMTVPLWQEINIMGSVIPAMMIVHIIWVAWSEKDNDLVEPRRRARLWIASALVLTFAISLLSEELDDPLIASILSLSIALPVSIVLLMWLTRFQPQVLRFDTATIPNSTRSESHIKLKPDTNAKDIALIENLITNMQDQKLYKQHGLTINALANTLNTQEHRLRNLINQHLGYRNFSTFLSHYRLSEVKQNLSDPNNIDLPITTIALDAGFSSLQTFNRVFKYHENCTPSEYRQIHCDPNKAHLNDEARQNTPHK